MLMRLDHAANMPQSFDKLTLEDIKQVKYFEISEFISPHQQGFNCCATISLLSVTSNYGMRIAPQITHNLIKYCRPL